MGRVRLVTDSTADIPVELLKKYEIEMVPLNVHFGNEVYKDQLELSSGRFYQMLKERHEHPRTSQPSPGDFGAVYERLLKAGDSVVSAHLTKDLSGTYQSAVIAANGFPDAPVSLIDTRLASIAAGMPVLEGAMAAQKGATREEVTELVSHLSSHSSVYFAVDTLDYLYRNGRIGRASHLLGSLLSMKPVLTLDDGTVNVVDKVRGKHKAMARMIEIVKEQIHPGTKARLAVAHAAAPDAAESMVRMITEAFGPADVLVAELGAVIGTHVGPGTIAVALTVLP